MNEQAIIILEKYIEDTLYSPVQLYPDTFLRERIYQRITAEDILEALIESPNRQPHEIIFEYTLEKAHYMNLAKTRSQKDMYHFMLITANEIDSILYNL